MKPMRYAVCCVPVSPLRIERSHKTEMISQLLFGECCLILETTGDGWMNVQCKHDNYRGWCQNTHFVEIDEDHYVRCNEDLTSEWVSEIDYNGHHMFVPLGSSLTSLQNGRAFWRKSTIHYSGQVWRPSEVSITPKLIKQLIYKFLNTSYLWGGRSVYGIDCSGLCQVVFKFLNFPIQRDAWQQAGEGNTVSFLQEAKCGDLAFFDNDEGKIIHVGILLNEHELIHSSGKVRIDKIDNQGIVNIETKQRTHKLRIIKRYF